MYISPYVSKKCHDTLARLKKSSANTRVKMEVIKEPNIPLEGTLLPALLQCFGIIFIGFILGKTKLLGEKESRGLNIFVQKLSLPSLIFMSVATMPFTKVKWEFIAAVFVVKAIIFVLVVAVTMLITHPFNLGKLGIYGIAATQSNDFALGYPLLVSLYQKTHPDYPSYLYIIGPIQLLVLNTVGFFLLETEKQNQKGLKKETWHFFLIVKDTVMNPVVIMTVLGLIWNVSFDQKILPILGPILKAFSSAFPATALLLVGYTMTARSEKSNSHISLSVALLILAKNLILPLVLQKFTTLMLQGSTQSEIESFSSFGFLYGTIPTAPTAYVFASQYATCVDVITKTVIGSTLLSAPLMFASSSVISLSQIGKENMAFYLSQTISYLSIFNIFCCVWLMVIFCTGKRWRYVSFGVTSYLVFAQFLVSVGGVMLFFSPAENTALFFAQYILTNGSMYATSMCAFLLAILLLVIRIRSLCFILQVKNKINILSALLCFILPYIVTASLLFNKRDMMPEPIFQLGFPQIVMTFVIRFLCLSGTIICLVLQQICLKRNSRNSTTEHNPISYQNPNIQAELSRTVMPKKGKNPKPSCSRDIEDMGSLASVNCTECDNLIIEDTHEICDSQYQCSISKRIECAERVSRYISENNEIGTGLNDNEYFFKHITLLIGLSVAMTLSIFTCFWKILMEEENGIFIEIEFLDSIVNYSLGILCFIMFGFDSNILSVICLKWKRLTGNNAINDGDSNEQKTICDDFVSNYLAKCLEDVGETKVINNVQYRYVFEMENLIRWLLASEITKCRNEAQLYTSYFMQNNLMKEFYVPGQCDKPFYKFLSDAYSL